MSPLSTKNPAKTTVSPVWAGVTSIFLYIHVGGQKWAGIYAPIGREMNLRGILVTPGLSRHKRLIMNENTVSPVWFAYW